MTVVAACDTDVERPATKDGAVAEATATLESLGDDLFDRRYDDASEWVPPDGCGEHPQERHQGEISHALFLQYAGVTAADDWNEAWDIAGALATKWEIMGHDVDSSGADASPAVSTRINGIEYMLVFFPPDASLRAYIPCY